jgi:hypothetical protein
MTQQRVIVVVFAMPDCPACEDYVPRFLKRAAPYQQQGGVPVFIYNAASEDPNLQAFADRFSISATPTTLVLPRGPGHIKVEGSIDDAMIETLLRRAYGIHLGLGAIRSY